MKRILFFISILFIGINSFGVNWIITDNGELIKIEHYGREVFNKPKGITQTLELPAKTGMNTTTVDKLFIGVNNDYPCQIAWNDVTVDGDAPTDLDNFSELVNVILNNVSGGSGDMTAAVYDSYTMIDQVTVIDVNVGTRTNCEALLGSSGAGIIPGQRYYFSTGCPTGISIMIVTGVYLTGGGKSFSPNAEALVTALGVYVPCTYDVATNVIHYTLTATLLFTGFSGSGSYEVLENNLGVVFGSLNFDSGGKIWLLGVSADFAKGADAKYVDVNVGTSRNQVFLSTTPYAYYDVVSTKIFISAVDATGMYSDDLWAATPIKITITAQY